MRRTTLLAGFSLLACSAPDRGGVEPAPSAVAPKVSAVVAARKSSAFEQLGRGRRFAYEASAFRARIDRVLTAIAPARASGVQRLVTTEVPGFELDLTPLDIAAAPGSADDGAITYEGVARETDLILATTPTAFEEVRVLHGPSAPSTFRWRVAHTPAVASVRVREGRVEAVDSTGYVRIGSAPMFAIDARGARLAVDVRLDNDVLVATVDTTAAAYPVVVDPAYSTAPSMAYARQAPIYAMQTDGKLFVVGGSNGTGYSTFSEEYNPTINAWNGSTNLPSAESGTPATNLGTGIVFAGLGTDGTRMAHWFAGSKAFQPGVPNSAASHRGGHGAVPISSNSVLVFGAGGGSTVSEIYGYNGSTWLWTATGGWPKARRLITGGLLPDGRPIAIGGEVDVSTGIFPDFVMTTSTMVYSISGKTWSAGPALNFARAYPNVVKLASGTLLVTGGYNYDTKKRVAVAEIYDTTTKTFKATGSMVTARTDHTATLLPNGKVLVAGGYDDVIGSTSTAELYDPTTGTFTAAGSMSTRRAGHGASALPGGKVLLFGGNNGSTAISSAEIFHQADIAGACTAGYECSSGNCVDATCCETSSCPMDSTCATGKCAKKGAVACSAGTECSSGNCVDGYCCNTACTGQCEACDISGKEGTCSPTSGAPHGSRAACTGAIVGGECGSQCDGTDTSKCNFPGTSKACGSRGCLDGVENTIGACNGSGLCSATPKTCPGYACQGDICGTSCETDAQCLSTHKCLDGKCAPRGTTCSADNTSVVETDGKTTPCAPFTCKAGVCQSSCASSLDCVGGAICDGSGMCVQPPAPAGGDDGGCSMGHGESNTFFALFAALAAIAARRARTNKE